MDSIFNPTRTVHGGVTHSSAWRTIKAALRRNLNEVIEFYRTHAMAVKSEHFLVRLLHSIDVPQNLSTERYMDNVNRMCLKLSMAMKMTSSIYRGHVFDGVFYGKGSHEILVAYQSSHRADVLDAIDDWRTVVPIRVLRHPCTSLNLQLPDGNDRLTHPDFSVFLIDLPLLAWQYRQFRLEEAKRQEEEGGNQRSTMQFIHMVVLPNMLDSHLDIAIFNRYRYYQQGWELEPEIESLHSFQVLEYNQAVDNYIRNELSILDKTTRDFSGVLHSIPLVSADTLHDAVQIPDLPPTQQVMWAISIARLPLILFLFAFNQNNPQQKNRGEVNTILRNIRFYQRNSIMKVLPEVQRGLIETDLARIETYQ